MAARSAYGTCRPITEAACRSDFSSACSRSMRAARIVCTVAGTCSASTGRVRRYAPRAPASTPVSTAAPGDQAPLTPAGLRTDLALARDEIRRLRAEHDQLRHRLRLQLGAEIDGPDRADLITRVAELESLTRQLLAERDARTTETDHAQRRIHELEDDLTAARESLRRVIKDHNRP